MQLSIGRVDKTVVRIPRGDIPGKPADFAPHGLCCGFIRVKKSLNEGHEVVLTDGKRRITVEIRIDIRPNRTAFFAIEQMMSL